MKNEFFVLTMDLVSRKLIGKKSFASGAEACAYVAKSARTIRKKQIPHRLLYSKDLNPLSWMIKTNAGVMFISAPEGAEVLIDWRKMEIPRSPTIESIIAKHRRRGGLLCSSSSIH